MPSQSYLLKSLSNVRRRSELISMHRGKADPVAMLGNASTMSFMADMGQREMLGQHQEQLQHYTGYMYALIRTGSNAIAGQPVRVGLFKDKIEERGYRPVRGRRPGMPSFHKHLVPKSIQEYTDEVDVVTDHVFLKTLHRPNDLNAMGKFALIQVTFAMLELCGVAYWWIRFPEQHPELDAPQIWPIPPSWVEPIHIVEDEYKKMFAAYKITPTGYAVPSIVPGSEICMFMYPDPSNPSRPLSQVQALARTLFVDESIEESQRRFFMNSHNPKLAVIVGQMPGTEGIAAPAPPVLTKHQRAQLVDSLNEEFRASANYGNAIILDGLIKDVKNLQSSVQEMDFMSSSDSAKRRLSECTGISPFILGELQNANRASSVAAKEAFYDIWTNPRITMFSEGLTHQVAPLFAQEGEEGLVAWIELCSARDIDFELLRSTSMIDRDAMTINEWREQHHMEPLPDGDVTLSEWRSTHQFTLDPSVSFSDDSVFGSDFDPFHEDPIEYDEDGNQKPEPPKSETESTGEKIAKMSMDAEKFHPRRGKPSAAKSWHDMIGHDAHARVVDKRSLDVEKDFKKSLRRFFQEMGVSVIAALKTSGGATLTTTAADTALSDSDWDDKLKSIMVEHIHRAATIAAVIEWNMHHSHGKPKGGFGRMMTKGFWDILANLPKTVVNAVTDTVRAIADKLKVSEIIDTVRDKVKMVIEKANEVGLDAFATIGEIQTGVFGKEETEKRADSIAGTETGRGTNLGGDAARTTLGKLGIVNAKMWMTQSDERVRATHSAAHGQTVGLDEKFTVGGHQCGYPGDPDLPASESCGCRCFAMSIKR